MTTIAASSARAGRARIPARARSILWAVDLAVLAAALVVFASNPTGAPTAATVVPADGRLVVEQPVGDARVLLAARPQRFDLIVAVRREKGWFGVTAGSAQPGGIAWAATNGASGIPSLSAVFGTVTAAAVRVRWSDGVVQTVRAASDGAFLASRPGHVRSEAVQLLGGDGRILDQVAGP